MVKSKAKLLLLIWTTAKSLSVPYFLLSESQEGVKRCLAILLLAAFWWVLEPVPSYVTSLALVPLTVASGILTADEAAASFFDPTMFLFITGFSLASCMQKHGVTHKISAPFARWAVRSVSLPVNGDFRFFTGISLLCVGLSSLVSNVAGSVLMTILAQSLAKQLGLDSNSHKRLLLTVAFACNIGGMTIPIASPQNVIALSALRTVSQDHRTVSFIEWLLLACPTVFLAIFVVYFVLKRKFGKINFGYSSPSVESGDCPEPDKERAWSMQQYAVIALMTVTVTGWCLFETAGLDRIFGHMGIFGVVAVACMHAFGLLGVEDLQSLPWSVLVLLGGGICLGTAVEKSGLLSFVAQEISLILSGFSVWLVFFILLSAIAVIANFLSSTVCGLIVFPIIAKVGMAQSHPKLFVVSAALMTSGAMALPVSSFPNANCAAVSDLGDKHKPILATSDYIKTGFTVGCSILALLVSAGFVWGTIVIDIN